MATFTAKPIDALPAATKLQDDDMIPICQDGYTDIQGLRQMVNFTAVKAGNVINVTSTLQGNKVHTDVITLDDNGYPTTILSDGVTTVFSFQGFDL